MKKATRFTLIRIVVEQKRELEENQEMITDLNNTISNLLIEKEMYRRECKRLQGYKEILTPIQEQVEFYAKGGVRK